MGSGRVGRVEWSQGINYSIWPRGVDPHALYATGLKSVWRILEKTHCGGPGRKVKDASQAALWKHFRRIATRAATPEEMDVLYPPKEFEEYVDNLDIEEACKELMKRILRSRHDTAEKVAMRDVDELGKPLYSDECGDMRKLLIIVAMGLFLREIPYPKALNRDCEGLESMIYLCPERIHEAALELNANEEKLVTVVWLHEFGHSMAIGSLPFSISEHYAQVAAAVALKSNNLTDELDSMVRLSGLQPRPYRWFKDGPPSEP